MCAHISYLLYNKRSHPGLNNYKGHTFESHRAQINNVKSNFLDCWHV
nr:MAG TPA: hypothetical protein [Caudoviricetes sp.]